MKSLLFFFLLIACAACSQQNSKTLVPAAFNYPDDQLGSGKIFVYQNMATKEKWFTEIKPVTANGKQYRSVRHYNHKVVTDSMIMDGGRLKEFYYFVMSNDEKFIKAQNIQDTIVAGEASAYSRMTSWDFVGKNRSLKTNFVETFLKDTVVIWQNKKLDGKIFLSKGVSVGKDYDSPNGGDTWRISLRSCNAEGIGLFRNSTTLSIDFGKTDDNDLQLVEIKELK